MTGSDAPDAAVVVNPALRVTVLGPDEILVKHGLRGATSSLVADPDRRGLLGPVASMLRGAMNVRQVVKNAVAESSEATSEGDAIAVLESLQGQGVVVGVDEHPLLSYLRVRQDLDLSNASSDEAATAIAVCGRGSLADRVVSELAELEPVPGLLLPEAPLDTAEAFTAGDVVIAAFDAHERSVLHELNEHACSVETPWLLTYMDGSHGWVGPLFLPGETPCYAEYEVQREGLITYWSEYLAHSDAVAPSSDGTYTLPTYRNIIAAWSVAALVPHLFGGSSFLAGSAMMVDFESALVEQFDPLRLPRCPACSGRARRHVFQ